VSCSLIVSYRAMFKRKLPAEYRERQPTLVPWEATGYRADDVRQALSMLSRVFRWSDDDGLRLRPEDKIWKIYHAYYPSSDPKASRWRRWLGSRPDELEMETLNLLLRKLVPSEREVNLHPSVTVRELVELLRTTTR
jgi:hypothetical protein